VEGKIVNLEELVETTELIRTMELYITRVKPKVVRQIEILNSDRPRLVVVGNHPHDWDEHHGSGWEQRERWNTITEGVLNYLRIDAGCLLMITPAGTQHRIALANIRSIREVKPEKVS
jgi:hypothetical protein